MKTNCRLLILGALVCALSPFTALAQTTVVDYTQGGWQAGRKATDKIGFYNKKPVTQPASTRTSRQALEDLGLIAPGGTDTAASDALSKTADDTLSDGVDYTVGSSSGTKIATATTQKLGFFNATPIVQPAGTVATRTTLQNLGLLASDGTITATASAGAATLDKTLGTITSEALTTAAGATYTLTLTNSTIAATSIVMASVNLGAGTGGTPTIASVTPASGSCVIVVQNIHASAAFNAAIKINFALIK